MVVGEVARRFGAHVEWLPFDLHPEYPPEGLPRAELRRRYGEDTDDRLRTFFAQHGLVFNPPEVMPNSLAALRLTELARDLGLHAAFHDLLMDATWAEARNIGDAAELRALAADAGLPGDAVEETLAGDAYAARIRASTAEAARIGVTGIPAFVLDARLLIVGARPVEVFEQAFAQIEAQPPAPPTCR